MKPRNRFQSAFCAAILATISAVALAAASLPSGGSALAQRPREMRRARPEKGRQTAKESAPVAPQLTPQDLEAFLDGFLPMQLQREDIAGAVVCVVKDGKVVLEKGYGLADVQKRTPVTPDATLFRPGSISKTFTWTAVMQLQEQDKIHLNRNIESYLDFKIRPWFGVSITMKDLMTHTPGFEESIKDLFVARASDMKPLDVYLRAHLPREIFPPGTTPAYSNYGAALAGYIVQRVSGMPFDDYIEKNILQPLGMNHTTFRQPLPANLAPLMSQGYDRASGKPKGFEYVQAWPAGSLSTTADDMSHWMIAQLEDGAYDKVQILKPETAELMHSRAWTNMPGLNGGDYGFYEMSRNGQRIIGHSGDTQWFHSRMSLMLGAHVGFFVSYNSAGKGDISAPDALWEHFVDRYFPYTPPPPQKVANSYLDTRKVVGRYWSSRRSQANIIAVTAAMDQPKVTLNSDGTISMGGVTDFAGNPLHFEEIAPMVFREVHGQEQLGFTKGINGAERLVTDFPFRVGQRVPALKNGTANFILIQFAMAVFILTLVCWPVGAVLRHHYEKRLELSKQYQVLRAWMRAVCVVDVAFLALFAEWISGVQNNLTLLSSSFDGWLHALQALGVLGVAGAVLSLYYCIYSWGTNSLWIWTRIWNTLLLLACSGYMFFVVNWHMLNFHLNY
jgi:CubicO group peptidase (beta-lactamase class C family)